MDTPSAGCLYIPQISREEKGDALMWYYFVPASLAYSYIGRKIGWYLSRAFLYSAPAFLVICICLLWGVLVALGIQGILVWLEPNTVLKWIFGYALGWYVAIPNFGLLDESTIPAKAKDRHLLISTLPSVAYLITSVLFVLGFLSFPAL